MIDIINMTIFDSEGIEYSAELKQEMQRINDAYLTMSGEDFCKEFIGQYNEDSFNAHKKQAVMVSSMDLNDIHGYNKEVVDSYFSYITLTGLDFDKVNAETAEGYISFGEIISS